MINEVAPVPEATPSLAYPESVRGPQTDDYHGVAVPDPYRWLEDMDSPAVQAWIQAQNELTFGHLEQIGARKALAQRLEQLWDFERWGVPQPSAGRLLVRKNDGLQNQAVLWVLDDGGAKPRVLLDPNALSPDGTVALTGYELPKAGDKLAYGLAEAGSDWQTWRVLDVASGRDLPDRVEWIKFSEPSWSADGRGFYYARYDAPGPAGELSAQNREQKVFYHRLGTAQKADRLIYARPDQPRWGFEPEVSEDGRWVVITVRVGTDPKTSILLQDARRPGRRRKTIELLPGFTARFRYVGGQGDTLWFLTDEGAPRGRLIEVDVKHPARSAWRVLIPESMRTLQDVRAVGGRFVATWLENAHSKVTVHGPGGAVQSELALPGLGTVGGWTGRMDDGEAFFEYTGFATPPEIWKLDPATGRTELWRRPTVGFDPADYQTDQVFYPSVDGTQVPMFISHRTDLKLDGQRPTYLYGYGGFNIPLTPNFSVPNLVWMEMGGVLAVPNLRGGGEFGEPWHQAGTKLRKQNVFDDFFGAARYLIDRGVTVPAKLAIGGRSNGGLLVGAALTQHPELFGAALPGVGVMDMLRFNKFTIGEAWESDYGSPQVPEEFAALFAYSPVHNARPAKYPATLIYTADHDDRVVPAHSYKFAAALQHAQQGPAPILIRIDTKSGHGSGKPTGKQIEEWADLWGFLVKHLGMDVRGLNVAGQGRAGAEQGPSPARALRSP